MTVASRTFGPPRRATATATWRLERTGASESEGGVVASVCSTTLTPVCPRERRLGARPIEDDLQHTRGGGARHAAAAADPLSRPHQGAVPPWWCLMALGRNRRPPRGLRGDAFAFDGPERVGRPDAIGARRGVQEAQLPAPAA